MTATFGRRERRRAFARLLLLQSCWSYDGMQGFGLALAMEPWLKRLYGSRARRELLRYDGYFNTHPFMAPLAVGMLCGLEEQAALADGERREALLKKADALKNAVACALAGVGDAFFWGALRPACAALALLSGLLVWEAGLSAGAASAATASVYLLAYNAPSIWLRWNGLRWGYQWKEGIARELKAMPWQRWIKAARWAAAALCLGLFVLAALAAPGRASRVDGLVSAAVYAVTARVWPAVTAPRFLAAVVLASAAASALGWLR